MLPLPYINNCQTSGKCQYLHKVYSPLIVKFIGPTCRPQVGPMLAQWISQSGAQHGPWWGKESPRRLLRKAAHHDDVVYGNVYTENPSVTGPAIRIVDVSLMSAGTTCCKNCYRLFVTPWHSSDVSAMTYPHKIVIFKTTWIRNHMPIMCGPNYWPILNFNGCNVEWTSDVIPRCVMGVNTYPCWD